MGSKVDSAHSTRGSRTAWNGAGLVKSMVTSVEGSVANCRSLGTGDWRVTLSRGISAMNSEAALMLVCSTTGSAGG